MPTCECGCGGEARQRFIRFHHNRVILRGPDRSPRKKRSDVGEAHWHWKGGRRMRDGYVELTSGGPHRREHVAIVEAVLGYALPRGSIVHHIDANRANNIHGNLCVLQSRRDHNELHRKLRVLRAGGNPWTDRLCCSCRVPKNIESSFYAGYYQSECIECSRVHARERMAARA